MLSTGTCVNVEAMSIVHVEVDTEQQTSILSDIQEYSHITIHLHLSTIDCFCLYVL